MITTGETIPIRCLGLFGINAYCIHSKQANWSEISCSPWPWLSEMFILILFWMCVVITRRISVFYAGKTKSYTSLADAVSVPSIQIYCYAWACICKKLLAHTLLIYESASLQFILVTLSCEKLIWVCLFSRLKVVGARGFRCLLGASVCPK